MHSGRGTLLVLALLGSGFPVAAAPLGKHLKLPHDAVIQIGKKTIGNSVSDAEMCKAYSVTAREVRHNFATYRLIDTHEKHYLYQHASCSIQGTVTLHGKTFPWIVNPGGTLETTYPDGVQKDLGSTDPSMLDTGK